MAAIELVEVSFVEIMQPDAKWNDQGEEGRLQPMGDKKTLLKQGKAYGQIGDEPRDHDHQRRRPEIEPEIVPEDLYLPGQVASNLASHTLHLFEQPVLPEVIDPIKDEDQSHHERDKPKP